MRLVIAVIPAFVMAVVHADDAHKPLYEHDIQIGIVPASHTITVTDSILLPQILNGESTVEFYLNAALNIEAKDVQEISGVKPMVGVMPLRRYRMTVPSNTHRLTLKYRGQILDEMPAADGSSDEVSIKGVSLTGASAWYPLFEDSQSAFTLHVSLPSGWTAVSQGQRLEQQSAANETQVTWRESNPQDEIYLVAGPFFEFDKRTNNQDAMVFLRDNDPALATKYLDLTAQYIDMYSKLIGPYPYAKFALVENYQETGFGMPSFTLLGSRVIRMPFILYSSYPHEILHNWWGNSVYVDYQHGNWSEGLTSYLADHLFQEQRGNGAAFRRDILQNYADYVSTNKDFPLTRFSARHDPSSAAVGYGKSEMLFHMLRRQVGDATFIDGLRELYRRFRFKEASFEDVAQVFSNVSATSQSDFFQQWVTRTGAPALALANVERQKAGNGWRLQGMLRQTQKGNAFKVTVPFAVTLAGKAQAWQGAIEMTSKEAPFTLELPAQPLRIDIDPEFDVFRALSRSEIPPALSQLFGADKLLMVLPTKAGQDELAAFNALIESWRNQYALDIQVTRDDELRTLPDDRSIWLLGAANRFADQMVNWLVADGVKRDGNQITWKGESYALTKQSLVLAARPVMESSQAVAWLTIDQPAAAAGLARKLPHYGKYSYLVFTGNEPTNIAKGQWSITNSALSMTFGESSSMAALKPRVALVP